MKKIVITINPNTNFDSIFEDIAKNTDHFYVLSFSQKPSIDFCRRLNALIVISPKIEISLTGWTTDEWHDLSFLYYLPNLQYLSISYYALVKLDFINSLPNLISLEVHETKKVLDLNPLSELHNLRYLGIAGKHKNHHIIAHLQNLKALLISGKLDVEFLLPLSLKHCCLSGEVFNIEKIGNTFIETLSIDNIKNLQKLDFINQMPCLKYLRLFSLKDVYTISEISENSLLELLIIQKMPHLAKFDFLRNAKNLQSFDYIDKTNKNIKAGDFEYLFDLEKIAKICIEFHDMENYQKFTDLCNKKNVIWQKASSLPSVLDII